ncbi:ER membrane protein complex subunit 8 [Ananas comosus]|uniref:ER membrane protein complex subunit 8 n=1 Tax=Ananas comosus TaxID=4615 RepID=A0A199VBY6_ANACO|nr:ER membrane protein complex subunit 8 [Ananas comosus]
MGAECRYELSQTAYIKLALHALKHPSSPVNGLLLGPLQTPAFAADPTVVVSDAVPLSHSQIGLLPSLELALIQVEEHFGGEGVGVVGYYHANERFDDAELGSAARKIGDHIFRYFPRAAVLLLDNRKLEELVKGKGRDPVVQGLVEPRYLQVKLFAVMVSGEEELGERRAPQDVGQVLHEC